MPRDRVGPVPVQAQAGGDEGLTELAREGRLFARELEVYYDVAPGRLDGFVASQLEAGSYRSASVLGETMLALPDLASAPA